VPLRPRESRLEGFVSGSAQACEACAKVLLKFKLLELQQIPFAEFRQWALATDYFRLVYERFQPGRSITDWLETLMSRTRSIRCGAARR
jgi:hypothetical protein